MTTVIIDTSVLVGAMDSRDVQHTRASAILRTLAEANAAVLLLDCVAIEAVGVFCRRREERRRGSLPRISELFGVTRITRAYPLLDRVWADVLAEVESSDGRLNAHDALILAYARSESVPFIASLDADFLGRDVGCLASAAEVRAELSPGG